MEDSGPVVVGVIAVAIVFFVFGQMFEGEAWRDDCTKISAHVSNGKSWDCKERAK